MLYARFVRLHRTAPFKRTPDTDLDGPELLLSRVHDAVHVSENRAVCVRGWSMVGGWGWVASTKVEQVLLDGKSAPRIVLLNV